MTVVKTAEEHKEYVAILAELLRALASITCLTHHHASLI